MIFARTTVHAEIEVWRHAKRSQNVPGRGDKKKDEDYADRTQAPPRFAREKPAREQQIDQRPTNRDNQSEQSFQQHTHTQCNADHSGPSSRVEFFSIFIQGALECHETDRDGQGKHHVRNKNARKKKESDRCGQRKSSIKTGAAFKGPRSITRSDKTQQHSRQGRGNTPTQSCTPINM